MSLEPKFAALSAVFKHCDVSPPWVEPTPPPPDCDAARIQADLTELTRSVQDEIRSRPDAPRLTDVSAAASKLEDMASGLGKACEDYFRRGAAESASSGMCRAGWTLMLLDWDRFQLAVRSRWTPSR